MRIDIDSLEELSTEELVRTNGGAVITGGSGPAILTGGSGPTVQTGGGTLPIPFPIARSAADFTPAYAAQLQACLNALFKQLGI
jgi:hypothetical protein